MQNPSRILELVTIKPGSVTVSGSHASIIPRSFCLGMLKIKGHFDNTLLIKNNCISHAYYARQKNTIDPSSTPLQTVLQAYGDQSLLYLNKKMGR